MHENVFESARGSPSAIHKKPDIIPYYITIYTQRERSETQAQSITVKTLTRYTHVFAGKLTGGERVRTPI